MSRIANIPMRDWHASAEELADLLTARLRTPTGTQRLWPIQAVALLELAELRGAVMFAEVGGGKTLFCALAATVFGAKRPLLLTSGTLLKGGKQGSPVQRAHWALRQHWRLPPGIRTYSYERLARSPGYLPDGVTERPNYLELFKPDLVICDEAHALKHFRRASAARRIRRYLEANPEVSIAFATATPTEHGSADYMHLLLWALRGNAPVPLEYDQQAEWALIFDPGVEEDRRPPTKILHEALGPVRTRDQAVAAWSSRLMSTPGIVVSDESWGLPGSISMVGHTVPTPPALEPHWERLRDYWERPDGWLLEDARSQVWSVARTLGAGFHYYQEPPPPEHWRVAHKGWASFCRDTISGSEEYDTAFQIAEACMRGRLPDTYWRAWAGVRDEYRPKDHRRTNWLSSHVLELVEAWGRRAPGLIWVEHRAFGYELARRTGWRYYDGLAPGNPETEDGRRTIILALKSCQDGLNLQHNWHRALWPTCPPTYRAWEQTIGRIHRAGQKKDVISVEYYWTCRESMVALDHATERAREAQRTFGGAPKLILADHTPPLPGVGKAWHNDQRTTTSNIIDDT